jgi:SAM-dependent methyltransferase
LDALTDIHENLPQMAASAYALAHQHCGPCRNFHALWPYLRIGRISSGVEGGRAALAAAIGDVCQSGPKDVLIAGAADTGVLCLAANAPGGRNARFFLADVCETPLLLCRDFAQTWNLHLETWLGDLVEFGHERRFDVIVAHSLLQYFAPAQRIPLFARLAAALRPGGRLLQIFNTGRRIREPHMTEYRNDYADWVLAQLSARDIALPEPRETFHARLTAYAEEREEREGVVESEDEVIAMMQAGGLTVLSCRDVDLSLSAPYTEFVAKIAKRRHLSIATVAA